MNHEASARYHPRGWLDTLAIGASLVCAVHCLATPVLLVALPVVATTVWVDAHFHLWMLGLVLPTSMLAVFLGCRKHRDKVVVGLCVAGLAVLASMAVYESAAHSAYASEVIPVSESLPGGGPADGRTAGVGGSTATAVGGCAVCAGCGSQAVATAAGPGNDANQPEAATGPAVSANALINLLGGLLLVLAHGRNFLLCRSSACDHA